jgi:hypothetical protein
VRFIHEFALTGPDPRRIRWNFSVCDQEEEDVKFHLNWSLLERRSCFSLSKIKMDE